VLKFDDDLGSGLHVGNMFFTVVRILHHLLPIEWKLVFPSSVPFCFRLPPSIAGTNDAMGPVPDPDVTAFRNQTRAANAANAIKARVGFATFFTN
jgi:hypothetical protein